MYQKLEILYKTTLTKNLWINLKHEQYFIEILVHFFC